MWEALLVFSLQQPPQSCEPLTERETDCVCMCMNMRVCVRMSVCERQCVCSSRPAQLVTDRCTLTPSALGRRSVSAERSLGSRDCSSAVCTAGTHTGRALEARPLRCTLLETARPEPARHAHAKETPLWTFWEWPTANGQQQKKEQEDV